MAEECSDFTPRFFSNEFPVFSELPHIVVVVVKTLDVVWSRLAVIVNVVVKGLAKTLLLLFSEVNRFSRWTVQNPVYAKAGGGTDRPTRL